MYICKCAIIMFKFIERNKLIAIKRKETKFVRIVFVLYLYRMYVHTIHNIEIFV